MKVIVTPGVDIAGLAPVLIEFVGDDGKRGARPSITVNVPDEGGSTLIALTGGREALKVLPESEVEARAALQAWIDELSSIQERGSAT